jgi:CheY-like chemotaxis protein
MPATRILVVDDNPANAKLVAYLLSNSGYEVTTAHDDVSALASIKSQPPQLILMDVQLPGVDGLELTRRIKADPKTRDIVVLAVTAYAQRGDEERARAAGCEGYVTKPINTRALPGIVARYLGKGSQ